MSGRKESVDSAEAMARVFVTALQAAGEDVRREVLARLLENEDLRDEVEAVLLWEERKNEDSLPLGDVLASLNEK
jgi:protein involved in sex pheromone biosynthesis